MKFILPNSETPILCQGITSTLGAIHTEMAMVYGSNIVAGVAREKGIKSFLDVPVFQTVKEAVKKTKPSISVIFSTPARALDDVTEAAKEKIPLIICTTEHVPLHDRLKMKEVAQKYDVMLIGPSSPGIVTVEKCIAGTMPAHLFPKGSIGVVSRSSSLTYEAVQQLSARELGVTACVALGTTNVLGTSFIPILQTMLSNPKVKALLVIGGISGTHEFELAKWYAEQKRKKPLVVYISGNMLPQSKKAPLLGSENPIPQEIIQQKKQALEKVGALFAPSSDKIGELLESVIKKD